jgi:hypothetical protein
MVLEKRKKSSNNGLKIKGWHLRIVVNRKVLYVKG